jgi:hypothetical protein
MEEIRCRRGVEKKVAHGEERENGKRKKGEGGFISKEKLW